MPIAPTMIGSICICILEQLFFWKKGMPYVCAISRINLLAGEDRDLAERLDRSGHLENNGMRSKKDYIVLSRLIMI